MRRDYAINDSIYIKDKKRKSEAGLFLVKEISFKKNGTKVTHFAILPHPTLID